MIQSSAQVTFTEMNNATALFQFKDNKIRLVSQLPQRYLTEEEFEAEGWQIIPDSISTGFTQQDFEDSGIRFIARRIKR